MTPTCTRPRARWPLRARLGVLLLAGIASSAALSGCTPAPSGPAVVVLFPGAADDDWGASASVLRGELAADGYAVEVLFAADDIPAQLDQVRAALERAPAAVVVAPVDATSVAAVLADADVAGVAVISYDRLILDSPAVDYYATFDHEAAGRMQAQALLDELGVGDPGGATAGPHPIELLAGSADDSSAREAFDGALEVLRPHLDAGTLVVPSGRLAFEQAAILRGSPATAGERVSELLASGVELEGVLSPSDAMSAVVSGVLADAGLRIARPDAAEQQDRRVVVTGGGSTRDGLDAIAAGSQSSTAYEDPRELARVVASMVREVVAGSTPTLPGGAFRDNGAREVPTRLLEPRLVRDAADAAELRTSARQSSSPSSQRAERCNSSTRSELSYEAVSCPNAS